MRVKKMSKNKNLIWHYTSDDILAKLLTGKISLAATQYSFLNDKVEVKEGYAVLEEYLSSHPTIKSMFPKSFWMKSKDVQELEPIFMLCFSKKGDDLYQWRSYTPKGGYSLGIDKKAMLKELEKHLKDLYNSVTKIPFKKYSLFVAMSPKDKGKTASDVIYMTGPCVYEKRKKEQMLNILFNLKDRKLIKLLAYAIPLFFKEKSFSPENEERLLIISPALVQKGMDYIGEKLRVNTFLKEDVLYKLLDQVFLSPHGDERTKLNMISLLKEKHPSLANLEIHKSSSAYRG